IDAGDDGESNGFWNQGKGDDDTCQDVAAQVREPVLLNGLKSLKHGEIQRIGQRTAHRTDSEQTDGLRWMLFGGERLKRAALNGKTGAEIQTNELKRVSYSGRTRQLKGDNS